MSPKLIMLVEDDLNLRQSIMLMLQRAGYFVTATDCVSKAMELIQSSNYQLIIVDAIFQKPKMYLLPHVLGIYPYLSILILTDKSAPELEKEERLLSAHYLVQPIAPERLLDCVGTILGKAGKSTNEKLVSLPVNHV